MNTTTEFNEADLPELPSPEYEHVFPSGGYSRTQMDAYALAAVAASRKKLAKQEQLRDDKSIDAPEIDTSSAPVDGVNTSQPAQAMDERETFHDWFDTYADPHSGRVERNIKRKAAWDAWQARAALAQGQASGKAEKYCDDHCTWRDHDPECVIGGMPTSNSKNAANTCQHKRYTYDAHYGHCLRSTGAIRDDH